MSAPSVPPLVEKTSARYTAQLVDETGTGVPASSLTTLTLTLYDVATLAKGLAAGLSLSAALAAAVFSNRNAQNVLNANGVTVDGSGNLVWTMTPADTAIVNDDVPIETHIALFQATWASGAKGCNHEVALPVRNLSVVT